MKVIITNHVSKREFNDKISNEDFILFVKKIINNFKLDEEDDGYYKVKDDKYQIVLSKKGIYFSLITFFSNSYDYLMTNINMRDFQCFYQGQNEKNRSTIRRITFKNGFKKITNTRKQGRRSSQIVDTNLYQQKRVKSKAIFDLYPNAEIMVKPKPKNDLTISYILDRKDNILVRFSIYQMLLLLDKKKITPISEEQRLKEISEWREKSKGNNV